jgi:hypothetical protein
MILVSTFGAKKLVIAETDTYLVFRGLACEKELRSDDIASAIHDEIDSADGSFLREATHVRTDHCH